MVRGANLTNFTCETVSKRLARYDWCTAIFDDLKFYLAVIRTYVPKLDICKEHTVVKEYRPF